MSPARQCVHRCVCVVFSGVKMRAARVCPLVLNEYTLWHRSGDYASYVYMSANTGGL